MKLTGCRSVVSVKGRKQTSRVVWPAVLRQSKELPPRVVWQKSVEWERLKDLDWACNEMSETNQYETTTCKTWRTELQNNILFWCRERHQIRSQEVPGWNLGNNHFQRRVDHEQKQAIATNLVFTNRSALPTVHFADLFVIIHGFLSHCLAGFRGGHGVKRKLECNSCLFATLAEFLNRFCYRETSA